MLALVQERNIKQAIHLIIIVIMPLTRIRVIIEKEKSKIYAITMTTVSILMSGGTMASIKYDSFKQFNFNI
jgi:hypothetical protein